MTTINLKTTPSRGIYRSSFFKTTPPRGLFLLLFFLIFMNVNAQKLDSIVVKHLNTKYLLVYAGDSLAKVHQFQGRKVLFIPKGLNYKLIRGGKGFNSLYIDPHSVEMDLWETYYQALEDQENQNQ